MGNRGFMDLPRHTELSINMISCLPAYWSTCKPSKCHGINVCRGGRRSNTWSAFSGTWPNTKVAITKQKTPARRHQCLSPRIRSSRAETGRERGDALSWSNTDKDDKGALSAKKKRSLRNPDKTGCNQSQQTDWQSSL